MLLMQFTTFRFSASSGKAVHIAHKMASEGVCDTPFHTILWLIYTDMHEIPATGAEMESCLLEKFLTREIQVNFAYIYCKSDNIRNGASKLL